MRPRPDAGEAAKLVRYGMHEPHEGFVPELAERFEAEYGYDPERARESLAEAGYPERPARGARTRLKSLDSVGL